MKRHERLPRPPRPARWRLSDDADQYAAAAQLNTLLRLWWVYWSPHRREYFAFYLGPEHVEPEHAADPQTLHSRLQFLQQRLVHPQR